MNERFLRIPRVLENAVDADGDSYQFLRRDDGRKLAVHTFGDPSYTPFFYLHGSPGWRGGPAPRAIRLAARNIFLICPTRPGYYESTPQPGRTLADTADDVAAVAQAMKIQKYYVLGRSGGGLHALAVASRNRNAVLGTGILEAAAPPDTMNDSWTAGMIESNAEILEMSEAEVIQTYDRLARLGAYENRGDSIAEFFRHVPPGLSQLAREDIWALGLTKSLQRAYTKSFREGGLGWASDVLALKKGFGNLLEHVAGEKVVLYYKTNDEYTPLQHGVTLQRLLPGSSLIVNFGERKKDDLGTFIPPLSYNSHFGSFTDLFAAAAELKRLQISST